MVKIKGWLADNEAERTVQPGRRLSRLSSIRVLVLVLVLALLGFTISTVRSQSQNNYWYMVRAIGAADLNVTNPVGLSHIAATNRFVAAGQDAAPTSTDAASTISVFSPFADPIGTNGLALTFTDPVNTAFVGVNNRLIAFDRTGQELLQLQVGANGLRPPGSQAPKRRDARILRGVNLQGTAVDESGGRLFVLDADGPWLFEIKTNLADPLSDLGAGGNGSIRRTRLRALNGLTVRGLAYNPGNGHVYIGDVGNRIVYELGTNGRIEAEYDVAELGMIDPQGMVVAPSADPTDDAAVMNLYVADSGGGQTRGQVFELSFIEPVALPGPSVPASLVRIVDMSKAAWSP